MDTRTTKIRKSKGAPLSVFLAIVLPLVGLVVTLLALWLDAKTENLRLLREMSQQKEDVDQYERKLAAVRKALDAQFLISSSGHQERNNNHPIQLYITDDLDRPIIGATVLVSGKGKEIVTNSGGLTPTLWFELGEKVIIEKQGFESEELVIDRDIVNNRVTYLKLRRHTNENEKGKN